MHKQTHLLIRGKGGVGKAVCLSQMLAIKQMLDESRDWND